MTRPLALLIVAATGAGWTGQERQNPVFRADTSAVMVDVTVKSRSGRVVTGLTQSDFTVLDNGVAQDISAVSYGKLPIDVTIGLDVSASVSGPQLESLRRAVTTMMRDLREGDRLKLMTFSTWITRTVDFTGDYREIDKALRAVTAGGGTALFDTLSVALTSATDPNRRQLVVLFTDGTDSSSTTSREMLAQIVDRTRATVSFVLQLSAANYLPVMPSGVAVTSGAGVSASRMQIDPAIQRVATDTGGSVMPAYGDLGLAFLRALDAFRSAYVLLYAPRGVERGGFHTIDVKVNRPDVVVQARRGYFGG